MLRPFWAALALLGWLATDAVAQVAPTPAEIAAYGGLHAAAAKGDAVSIPALVRGGADVHARDGNGRTPLHVACFLSHQAVASALVAAGADPKALDRQKYDCITIAAVKDDVAMMAHAIRLGGDAKAITSPYEGTALIAAAHLGHDGVVQVLIKAGAPLDHVNNLGWTALIESIVLGNGGPRHTQVLKDLLAAGANPNLADRNGMTPLALAKGRGYDAMAALITAAGGR